MSLSGSEYTALSEKVIVNETITAAEAPPQEIFRRLKETECAKEDFVLASVSVPTSTTQPLHQA